MSMFVSRSLDYALRSLIFLAQEQQVGTTNLREIAAEAAVPRSYLAKLMRTLVRSELVRSDAGVKGGYKLARQPQYISLKEIYEAVEGNFRTVVCDDSVGQCALHDDCTQIEIWNDVEREILGVLERRNLADFVVQSNGQFVPLGQLDQLAN